MIQLKDKNGKILTNINTYCATNEQVQQSIDNRIKDGTIEIPKITEIPDITPEMTTFMKLCEIPSKNLFTTEKSYNTIGNINTGNGGFVEKSDGTRLASDFIPIKENEPYFLSVEKNTNYLGGNYFYVVLYDSEKNYISKINFDSGTRDYASLYTFAKFTPTVNGYMQLLMPNSSDCKNIMLTISDSYVPYIEYGNTYSLDINDTYKKGFIENIIETNKYKEIINFENMSFTDENSISSMSDKHTKNAQKTLKLTTTSTDYVGIDFGKVNLETDGKNLGYWMWVDGKTVGANGTAIENGNGSIKFTIGNYSVERKGVCLNAGLHYYLIPLDRIGSQIIGDLKIEIKSGTGNEVSFYLDSIQFGYQETMPHIIFDFDSPPKDMNTNARDLFNKYNIPMSIQTHMRDNGESSPSYENQTDALLHFELIAEGHEYCSYSLYNGDYHTTGQPADYDTDYDNWYKHFVEGYKTGNIYGIFCPTFLNANFHLWGDAYCKAGRDAGYLGIRGNRVQLDLNNSIESMEKALFTNFDDEYRHVTPFFLAGAIADSEQQARTIAIIDRAIELGQNILISSHSITTEEGATDTMYTGEVFMENILSHVKEKVDAGLIKATTWIGYIKDVRPDLYAEWVEKKSRQEYNFLMNKQFGN